MQTPLTQLDHHFRQAIEKAFEMKADPLLTLSQNPTFGDYQSNVAMGLAKQLSAGGQHRPRAVAEQIKGHLQLGQMASDVSIAGPGFINVKLSPEWVSAQLNGIASDPRLGVEAVAMPQTVVVDYSGPNVAKEMHVGHLRSTIIGDAIARLLEFQGHRVIRQNHIGDWGTQFGMLIAYLREAKQAGDAPEAGDAQIGDLDRFYKEARKRFDADEAFANQARATVVRLQAGGPAELSLWSSIVAESRRHFEPIYGRLSITLKASDERGESFYNPMLADNLAELRRQGIARESDGAIVAFTEGAEAPLILEKTGGGFGYASTDLAAIRFRVQTLKADRLIYFVGSPQSQHFKQVFEIARRSGWTPAVLLEHAAFGSVLGEDGKMFKARSGESVKLAELLREAEERALVVVSEKNPDLPADQRQQIAHAVGIGAVKYADLSKDRLSDYVFSFDRMLAMEGNTAPYLQYAHARIRSIFRKAQGGAVGPVTLGHPAEIHLGKHLLRLGEVIELVGRELKPHHLCTYLYEVATRFSGFYENCPVIQSEEPTRASRLALCDLTARTLACGLDLLGIEHPEAM